MFLQISNKTLAKLGFGYFDHLEIVAFLFKNSDIGNGAYDAIRYQEMARKLKILNFF